MRIVIVEDEIPLRNSLKEEILSLNENFTIVGEASGVLDGIKLLTPLNQISFFLILRLLEEQVLIS